MLQVSTSSVTAPLLAPASTLSLAPAGDFAALLADAAVPLPPEAPEARAAIEVTQELPPETVAERQGIAATGNPVPASDATAPLVTAASPLAAAQDAPVATPTPEQPAPAASSRGRRTAADRPRPDRAEAAEPRAALPTRRAMPTRPDAVGRAQQPISSGSPVTFLRPASSFTPATAARAFTAPAAKAARLTDADPAAPPLGISTKVSVFAIEPPLVRIPPAPSPVVTTVTEASEPILASRAPSAGSRPLLATTALTSIPTLAPLPPDPAGAPASFTASPLAVADAIPTPAPTVTATPVASDVAPDIDAVPTARLEEPSPAASLIVEDDAAPVVAPAQPTLRSSRTIPPPANDPPIDTTFVNTHRTSDSAVGRLRAPASSPANPVHQAAHPVAPTLDRHPETPDVPADNIDPRQVAVPAPAPIVIRADAPPAAPRAKTSLGTGRSADAIEPSPAEHRRTTNIVAPVADRDQTIDSPVADAAPVDDAAANASGVAVIVAAVPVIGTASTISAPPAALDRSAGGRVAAAPGMPPDTRAVAAPAAVHSAPTDPALAQPLTTALPPAIAAQLLGVAPQPAPAAWVAASQGRPDVVATAAPPAITAGPAPILPAAIGSTPITLVPITLAEFAAHVTLPLLPIDAAPLGAVLPTQAATNDLVTVTRSTQAAGTSVAAATIAAPAIAIPGVAVTPAALRAPAPSLSAPSANIASPRRPAHAAPSIEQGDTQLAATLAPAASAPTETPRVDSHRTPLDMRRDDWTRNLIDRIDSFRDAANAHDTRIRLVPEALGRIDVTMRQTGETLQVHFAADKPATQALLADARPQLADLAEARGLKLADATPGAGATGAGGSSPFADQRRPQPPFAPPPGAQPARPRADAQTDSDHRIA